MQTKIIRTMPSATRVDMVSSPRCGTVWPALLAAVGGPLVRAGSDECTVERTTEYSTYAAFIFGVRAGEVREVQHGARWARSRRAELGGAAARAGVERTSSRRAVS